MKELDDFNSAVSNANSALAALQTAAATAKAAIDAKVAELVKAQS